MGLPPAIIAETAKIIVTYMLLETGDLDDRQSTHHQLAWERGANAKVQKDYNKTLVYIETQFEWVKIASANKILTWKRWDDEFKDTVHKFQVTCKAGPELVKDIVGDIASWPSWFRLIEKVDILADINDELRVAFADVAGVAGIIAPRALLSGVYVKDDPDSSAGGFLMLLTDIDWPGKEEEMRQQVRLKTNVIAIRGQPLPPVQANEIDDDVPRTNVEFYFSADFGLPGFVPKAVIFRVFVPLVRRSIASLQATVEKRQRELYSK